MRSAVVLVLSIFFVNICHSKKPERISCEQLPKVEIPSIEVMVANSPLRHDFVLIPYFNCSMKVFTGPERGTTHYHGTALNIKGSDVIPFDYTIGSDKKSLNVTVCNTGKKMIWYAAALQFDNKGGFCCLYSCNNTELSEFACLSNNGGTSPDELKAVKLARKVSNGYLIHNARENCPASKGCSVF